MTQNQNVNVLPALNHLRQWEPQPVQVVHVPGADGLRPGLVFRPSDYAARKGEILVGQVMRRSDTLAPLGQVGPAYTPVSNSSKVELFEMLHERGVIDTVRSGEFSGGARVWIQAKPQGGSVTLPNGHQVQANLSVLDGYDGSLSLTVVDSATNIVCRNTFATVAKKGIGTRLRHTTSVRDRFETVCLAIRDSVDNLHRSAEAWAGLSKSKVSHADGLRAMLDKFWPMPVDDATERRVANAAGVRNRIAWAYEYAPGAEPGTRFGLLQAATYYLTHEAGSDAARFESGLVGPNRTRTVQVQDWLLAQMN